MQFTENSHRKSVKKFLKVIPSPMIVIFVLILLMSVYSIIKNVSSSGLQAFGSLGDVFAAITTGSSLGSTTAAAQVSNNYKIVDSWGRCQVDNPNATKKVQQLADTGFANGFSATSKSGINQGNNLTAGEVNTEVDFMNSKNLNMTYILGLTTDPGGANGAVEFIKAANAAQKMPVVRLCFDGGCGFNISASDASIVDFYTAINQQLQGTDNQFIGVVGPNEPTTEMKGFGISDGDYTTLVKRANSAATKLQQFRVDNGGNMYIAPAIFNGSDSQPGHDDVKGYLYSDVKIQPDLFDFLMANEYDVQGQSAANFYDEAGRSVKQFVTQNGLYSIISEFGYFPNSGGESALKASYDELCNDDTVDGILFFRPDYPQLNVGAPRQDPPIDSKVLANIIDSCTKPPTKINLLNSAWINCNFDSCVSKTYTYSSRSVAHPVIPVIANTGSSLVNPAGTPSASCQATANTIYSTQTVKSIASKGNKDTSKIIIIGDSITAGDPLANSINVGQPGASTFWFVGQDPIDPNNPLKVAARQAYINSLSDNAFAAIIMLGSNDCGGVSISDFKNNLTTIAQSYADHGIIPILSTFPNRNIGVAAANKLPTCADTTDSFNSVIKNIALTHNWPLRDANAMVQISDLAGGDGLHPTNYACLDAGSTNMINQLQTALNAAPSAGTQGITTQSIPTDPTPKAWLKINCNGGSCNAKQINTIQTWLPIKSLGSTTATNTTNFRSYTPSCVELASQVSSDQYDLLNQFAGKLSSGSDIYPMPWLGSLINCLSELSDYTSDFAGNPLVQSSFNPHPFSKKTEADAETKSDMARNLAQTPVNTESVDQIYKELKNTTVYIPDERTVCIKDKVTGKQTCYDNSAINTLKTYRAYDSTSVPNSWYSLDYQDPASDSIQSMIYLQNKDDMLPGPEITAGTQNYDFTAGDLCRRYGIRKIDDDTQNNFRFSVGDNMNCSVDLSNNAVFDSFEAIPGVPSSTVYTYCRSVISDASLKSDAYINGTFNTLKDSRYSNCFIYTPQPTDRIETLTQNYASTDQYNIEGIYDALYKQYLRLDTEMSNRQEKIIFQKDIGWQGEVDSIIRDSNQPVDVGDYLYVGEYDSAKCENVTFFNNKTAKARGSPVKKTMAYYPQVGALEPMQEWLDVYTNNASLPGEMTVDNPFYNPNDSSKPNNTEAQILVPGTISTTDNPQLPASLTMNFPLPTCDQVNIAYQYSNSDLVTALKSMDKYKNMSDADIQSLANLLWPYSNKMPLGGNAACIANRNDTRFSDEMSSFLCKQGYSIDGVCQNYCPTTGDGGGNNSGFALIYPTSQTKVIQGYGVRRTYTNDQGQTITDVHTGLDFAVPTGTQVHAAAAGTVIYAGWDNSSGPSGGYGNYVEILHGNGFVTLYGHNSQVLVKVGDHVNQGQLIALSGATGNATGPHVHFELRKNQTCIFDGNASSGTIGTCSIDPSLYLTGVPSETPVSTPTTNSANAVQPLDAGGVVAQLDMSSTKFVATPANQSVRGPITDFATANNVSLAINSNFQDGAVVEGLHGGNGVIGYDVGRGVMDYAFIFKNGTDLSGGDPEIAKRIIAQTDKLAIVNIRLKPELDPNLHFTSGFTPAQAAVVGKGADIALSGLALLVDNGVPLDSVSISQYSNFSNPVQRTIIGWKTGGSQLVMAVVNSATLSRLVDIAANQLGLQYAISLDGGGSSQIYLKAGFDSSYDQNKLFDNGTVYWPKQSGETPAPRNVINYLGIVGDVTSNSQASIQTKTNSIACVPAGQNPDVSGPPQVGKLTCNINTGNTGDFINLTTDAPTIESYVKAYNLDNNASYTWLADPLVNESDSLQKALIAKLGSVDAYNKDRQQRVDVTNFVINYSKSLGLNPKFVLTQWIEESGGSALGNTALGCLGFRTGGIYSSRAGNYKAGPQPFPATESSILAHLKEQIQCIDSYIKEFPLFSQYMCTFSGEAGYPSCDINNFTENPNFPMNICKIYTTL